jgi:hypothetical protein
MSSDCGAFRTRNQEAQSQCTERSDSYRKERIGTKIEIVGRDFFEIRTSTFLYYMIPVDRGLSHV